MQNNERELEGLDPGPAIEREWFRERDQFRNLAHQLRSKAETAHVATADILYKIAREIEGILNDGE